ncbi:MAG TPA: PIN domain-containing protein [Rhizomicrobium sp.]|jgi:predicted nucleic acid-binding protein
MRVAVDTNVLVYAQGVDDAEKQVVANRFIERLAVDETVIPTQVVGELYNVLVKRGRKREVASHAANFWRAAFGTVHTSNELMATAVDLATEHHMKIWDAVVLAAAAEGRCDVLLSEDFQDGFAWRGVTVVNPFAAKPHKLLAKMLRG